MIIDIFIRTYPKDFTLLFYSIKSIKKYVKGYRNIIICVREKNYIELIKTIDTQGLKVVKEHNFDDNIDYIGQQITKLQVDIWSDADYICYVDSDCIFNDYCDLEEYYFTPEKNVILLKDEWCNVGDAKIWKFCLEYLNLKTEYEFMRRLPQIYPSNILYKIRELIVNKTGKDFINSCIELHKKFKFSEFNIMGSYLYKFEPEKICFMDTKNFNQKIVYKQFYN